ncbi:hypothetical protein MPSI1_001774 [Malassezia psittaci]|uniref:Aldehyde dehydrogenase n=1 Tax=Malassezia psittaci TaxID=1821823 RepID=A0AAF0FB98_9BASI|nr:hypothetical protein MPSI1_001774 [Malassezia psittaci]
MASVVKNTPVKEIPQIVNDLRASFLTGKTRSIEYRKKQLKQFAYLIADHEQDFCKAIAMDLGRPTMETGFAEIISVKNEIIETVQNLSKWAKPTSVSGGPAYVLHDKQIRKDPQGTVLVMGAWNYPITVQLGPMVGAIAAGNTAILKPSELAPHSAQLIADLWPEYMDPETSRIVNGGIDESSALLEQRFEHIFYTGNGRVGRIIAEKAAKWLCPTTLELGGKSPVIVDATADLNIAAHRILWAKAFNTGQTCIAPDYVLVERSVQDQLVTELKKAADEFWPSMDKTVEDFGRMVNERHWQRVHDLLDKTKGDVVLGGTKAADQPTKFLPLTIVKNVTSSDSTMSEEIFGPVLPLMPFDKIREVVDFVNANDQPLALYMFTNSKAVKEYILTYTRSGAVLSGDLLLHYVIPELPFGGTGPAGYGAYHGKASFDCFTHHRSFVDAPASGIVGKVVEKIMARRYPPYSSSKMAFFKLALGKYMLFGRPSNPTQSTTSINNPISKSVRTIL